MARVDRFALFHARRGFRRRGLERRLRALVDRPVRVRAEKETPFLRHRDAVLPQLRIKDVFGEFAAAPVPGGALQ